MKTNLKTKSWPWGLSVAILAGSLGCVAANEDTGNPAAGGPSPSESGRWTMWSEEPAGPWRDAMVTGNGSHGTMVMGRPGKETITCVHEELWISAWDRDVDPVPDISHLLPEVRKLIRAGKQAEAANLAISAAEKANEPKGVTNNGWPVVPHPAFDLELEFEASGELADYHRQLDLETGVALSRWADSGNRVEQRVFSSRAHNVNVVELRAAGNGKLNLHLRLVERPGRVIRKKPVYRNVEMNGAFKSVATDAAPGWLFYHADYALDRGGYDGVARVTTDGEMDKEGKGLRIRDADRVLLVLRIRPTEDGAVTRRQVLQKELQALPASYEALLKPHASEHGEMFRRVTLDLGCGKQWREQSIEQLLADIDANGVTPRFLEAVHAMGRYLLIRYRVGRGQAGVRNFACWARRTLRDQLRRCHTVIGPEGRRKLPAKRAAGGGGTLKLPGCTSSDDRFYRPT